MAVRDTKNSGSHNASRKYGVICRQEEACIVRKMGVAEKDTAGLGSLGALFSCMRAGDTLCVPVRLVCACAAPIYGFPAGWGGTGAFLRSGAFRGSWRAYTVSLGYPLMAWVLAAVFLCH